MSTISSISNANAYNPQITNKVAAANNTNLANNAANQSAFSSYIGQALAQMGVSNPTNALAPVVSSANQANTSEKSLSTFIQDLFSILSQRETQQIPTAAIQQDESNFQQFFSQGNEFSENNGSTDNEFTENNTAALEAYTSENSTTVGNIIANLQKLVDQLDGNQNSTSDETNKLQSLQNDFQIILDAQGATTSNPASLGTFLQTLAQNLQGQSPLGIIINTFG